MEYQAYSTVAATAGVPSVRLLHLLRPQSSARVCRVWVAGKSSQVPQLLLEAGMGPVLCTQPRRLAVVAVANRVAQEMQCELGTDVGYRIGQRNLSSPK